MKTTSRFVLFNLTPKPWREKSLPLLFLSFIKTTFLPPQVQLTRLKEANEKVTSERDSRIAAENREKEALRRVQRQLRESKDEQSELLKREQEALKQKHELVRQLVPGVQTYYVIADD